MFIIFFSRRRKIHSSPKTPVRKEPWKNQCPLVLALFTALTLKLGCWFPYDDPTVFHYDSTIWCQSVHKFNYSIQFASVFGCLFVLLLVCWLIDGCCPSRLVWSWRAERKRYWLNNNIISMISIIAVAIWPDPSRIFFFYVGNSIFEFGSV